jgi:ADP-heptose:LPS heptosyltransferase
MHALVARLDNDGDVLLSGPAVRAVADAGTEVTYLCRPGSAAAAALLPGVRRILTFDAAWISGRPKPVDRAAVAALMASVEELEVDEAMILTSFHQSPLPLALLLRLAGVDRIAAISEDYPGSLLDVRHHVPDGVHEVERNLSLVETLGYRLAPGDDGRLQVRLPPGAAPAGVGPGHIVIHPGASVPARALPLDLVTALADALIAGGRQVVVTGGRGEWAEDWPWPPGSVNLAGATDLAGLGHVLASAAAVVVGNTGPAHLAAALGTPVVSVFAPTVPLAAWHPWAVAYVALGAQAIGCRHCRSRSCPIEGQPCTAVVTVDDVMAAIGRLTASASADAGVPAGAAAGSLAGAAPPERAVA